MIWNYIQGVATKSVNDKNLLVFSYFYMLSTFFIASLLHFIFEKFM